MEELKQKAATQNFESAYIAYNHPTVGNNPTYMSFSTEVKGNANDQARGIGVGLEVTQSMTQTKTNATTLMHCHLDNGSTYKIFTLTDIYYFCQMAQWSTQPKSAMGIYVVTSSGTFALKVSNIEYFNNLLLTITLNKKYLQNKFEENVSKDDNIDDQVKGFLKFLKDNIPNPAGQVGGSGIDLYRQNADNSWSKLTLNGKNIKETKC